jgi:hypothetical protein
MSFNTDTQRDTAVTARATLAERTYSRKRWNPFEAWQEHIRKSAATVGSAFSGRPDRDLRRAIVAG